MIIDNLPPLWYRFASNRSSASSVSADEASHQNKMADNVWILMNANVSIEYKGRLVLTLDLSKYCEFLTKQKVQISIINSPRSINNFIMCPFQVFTRDLETIFFRPSKISLYSPSSPPVLGANLEYFVSWHSDAVIVELLTKLNSFCKSGKLSS